MLVDGLKAIAVALVYVLIPAVLLTVAVFSLLLPLTQEPPTWVVAVAGIVTLLAVPVTLLAVYTPPRAS
jgi:membrane protein YdbS with pleckstrin-like domain